MKKKNTNFGKLIMAALTEDQLATLLEILVATGNLKALINQIEPVDSDLATTLSQVLNQTVQKRVDPPAQKIASRSRIVENWNSLWKQWNHIIAEIGYEEGKYAVQDVDWEPPYFGAAYLAEDLEKVAAGMLPLIDTVFEIFDQPELYTDALHEIEYRIDQYPEWMGAQYGEPCVLEKNVTRCVLMWLLNASKQDAVPGRFLVDQLMKIQEVLSMVELDPDEWVEWFSHISDETGREIYDHMTDEAYRFDLQDVYSPWHRIYHHFQSRYDTEKHLGTCRQYLTSNWRYGRPLVEAAYKRKEIQEAESWLEKTFSSYLGTAKKNAWRPEDSLLLSRCDFMTDEDGIEIDRLLRLWKKAAAQLGEHPRSAAAELQAIAVVLPENWDAVIKAYKRLTTPQTEPTLMPLFDQWKTEMALRSLPYHLSSGKIPDTWIHWLIEARLEPGKNQKGFSNKLEGWLGELEKDNRLFKKQWPWLARLTGDWKGIEERYPALCQIVLPADKPSDSMLEQSRRRSLQKMKVDKLRELLMRIWQKHLIQIVPDPSDAYKSSYRRHADWAKALHELNPEAYTKLLQRWRKKHNRRRNLWRDLKSADLPI